MLYWNTGDRVVDCILRQMEGFSTWREDSDPEQTHQLLGALIGIEKMLPKAVSKHFKLPYLYVGNAHFEQGDIYRRNLISEITTALKEGLEQASADPDLKRDGGADFSDRPRSRGEEILDAIDDFDRERTTAKLSRLKMAISSTNLQYRVNTIEKLISRTRPYQNQDPAVAIGGELHRLKFEAEGYHSVRA